VSVNRLGKGLGALIRPQGETKKKQQKKFPKLGPGVNAISLKDIKPNPNQPRRKFDEVALEELMLSISAKGVVTPITVREVDSGYEIIAGERRWRASKKAKKRTIPAYIIKTKNDAEIMEISLIENIQRADLNAIEEANAFAILNSKYGMSHQQIAKSVGKRRATISNSLRLLKLPSDIRKSLREGQISAGHARAILQGKTIHQMTNIWKKIIKDNLSVRSAEDLLKNKNKSSDVKKKKIRNISPEIRALEDRLVEVFGTKVNLKTSDNGGIIEISYFSDDDLDRLIELIDTIH